MKKLSISLVPSDVEALTAARRKPRCRPETLRYIQVLFAISSPDAGERAVARNLQVSRSLVRKVVRLFGKGGISMVLAHVPVASRPRLPAERVAALKALAAEHPDWGIRELSRAASAAAGHISLGTAAGILKGRRRRSPPSPGRPPGGGGLVD